jgi:hypothetical protein
MKNHELKKVKPGWFYFLSDQLRLKQKECQTNYLNIHSFGTCSILVIVLPYLIWLAIYWYGKAPSIMYSKASLTFYTLYVIMLTGITPLTLTIMQYILKLNDEKLGALKLNIAKLDNWLGKHLPFLTSLSASINLFCATRLSIPPSLFKRKSKNIRLVQIFCVLYEVISTIILHIITSFYCAANIILLAASLTWAFSDLISLVLTEEEYPTYVSLFISFLICTLLLCCHPRHYKTKFITYIPRIFAV